MYQVFQAAGVQPWVTALLRAYHHDAPLLFLGASFLTIAVVPAGFSLIRRHFDLLLLFPALFACLYGQRLRFDSEVRPDGDRPRFPGRRWRKN